MHDLSIETSSGRAVFRPGEPIEGTIRWSIDSSDRAEAIEIRLVWYTEGKGTRDADVAHRLTLDRPPNHGEQTFRFTAPIGPNSFSGKLITLIWALELVVIPDDHAIQVPITISPTGLELRLHANGTVT